MRFLYYPDNPRNPYQRLFAGAMARQGVVFEPGLSFTDAHLVASAATVRGVHLHWLENLVNGTWWMRARRIVGLRQFLRCAKRLGMCVMWTVHNHVRHAAVHPIDRWANRLVARCADVLIVHSECSARVVRERWSPRGKIVVMPHGNFDGCYHVRQTAEQVRAAWGLRSGVPTLGLIGSVRPNRGHELAIEAAGILGQDVQLLIAGFASDHAYAKRLEALARPQKNVVCRIERLNDEDYAHAVTACDVVLLPYQNITTSGSLLSAWTLSRPVVTSDLPYFHEMLSAGNEAGMAMRGHSRDALVEAVRSLLALPRERTFAAARGQADRYAWDHVIAPVVDALNQIARQRGEAALSKA